MVARTGPRPDRDKRTGFVYHRRDLADVRKRAERQLGRFDSPFKPDFSVFKPHDGDNCTRILPPTWEKHEHFGLTVFMHEYVGPDKSTYLCLKKMLNKRCPCCDAADEVRRDGDVDEAKQMQWREKILYWILDREGDDPETPLIWVVSTKMDQDITIRNEDKRTNKVLHIDAPDDGYDIMFTRTGKGLNTRYPGLNVDRQPSPIHDKQKVQDEIMDFIIDNPLPTVLHYYSEEYLDGVMSGTTERADPLDKEPAQRRRGAEVEEEASPSSRRSRGREDAADQPERSRRSGDTTEEERGSRRTTRAERDEAREDSAEFRQERGGGYTRRVEPGRDDPNDNPEDGGEEEEARPTNRRASSRTRSEEAEPATTSTRRGKTDENADVGRRRAPSNGADKDEPKAERRSGGRSEPAEEPRTPQTRERVKPSGAAREETRRVGSGRRQYRD